MSQGAVTAYLLNLIAKQVEDAARQAGGFALKLTTQRGYLQGYAVTMLLGVAVILLVVFL